MERIRVSPYNYIKKLFGDPGYKLRVGDYRVIIDINNTTLLVLVIKIGRRRNAKKLFLAYGQQYGQQYLWYPFIIVIICLTRIVHHITPESLAC